MSSRPSPLAATDETVSDIALVAAAKTGERWAQEALYRRHAQRSFALAVRLLGERDLAWDAVHNGFITAFGKIVKLREAAAFGGWLRTIIVRETLLIRRRRRGDARVDGSINVESVIGPEASAEEHTTFLRCQRWLHAVREPDRTIYLLKVLEACELGEIAELTGVSVATVKRKVARVEEHMRRLGGDT